MESIEHAILIGAVVMSLGIVVGAFSARLGVPFLLVFLAVGMLAGVDGPGGIKFSNTWLSFLVGNVALAIILLDGGLRTRFATFRVALRPSLSLATLGVAITAGLVGAFASWLLAIDWKLGLLLGAIVGSTDAAAVFSLLNSSGIRLKERVGSVLEIESGINDPMAIFLTLTLIEWITAPDTLTPGMLVWRLVVQFGVGGVLGIGLGYCLANVLERIQVAEGLQALLVCSGGTMVFAIVQTAGGSGFLAVYLAGVLVGNRERAVTADTMRAMDGMAWLAQSAMFLLLGLLVTPHRIWDIALPALAVALFLMFVARPVAVMLALLPFRFNAREKGFFAWMGLRGAVPIVLSLFPLLKGMEDSGLVFRLAFAVVLASLLCQGTTVALAARLARVLRPSYTEPLSRERLRGTHAGGGTDAVRGDRQRAGGGPARRSTGAAATLPHHDRGARWRAGAARPDRAARRRCGERARARGQRADAVAPVPHPGAAARVGPALPRLPARGGRQSGGGGGPLWRR